MTTKNRTITYANGVTIVLAEGAALPPVDPAWGDVVSDVLVDAPTNDAADMEKVWQEKLSGFITDPVTGLKLKADVKSKDLFTSAVVILDTGMRVGAVKASDPFPVWDFYGEEHPMTAQEALAVLVRYGLMWAEMWRVYAP